MTPAVCTLVGNMVTLQSDGICSIQAIQEGNEIFQVATPVTRTFQVMDAGGEAHRLYLPVVER